MLQLPPIPSLDALHPLVIHFPIALLLVSPLFILIGAALSPARARAWHMGGLLLMALGTVSVLVALESGEAAARLAERSPEINVVLERHSGLAETTAYTFGSLTIAFTLLLAIGRIHSWDSKRVVSTILPLVFLVAYAAGALLLVNTAHHGGRLVHELGVHALVASPQGEAPTAHPSAAD